MIAFARCNLSRASPPKCDGRTAIYLYRRIGIRRSLVLTQRRRRSHDHTPFAQIRVIRGTPDVHCVLLFNCLSLNCGLGTSPNGVDSRLMFVDRIRVYAQAGDGGRGCVSFRREKFVPHGGPDGGDGGRGGDVILRADIHTDNLSNLYHEPIVKAPSGAHGQGKKKHGRSAKPKIVKVPVGTVVHQIEAPIQRNDDGEYDELEAAAPASNEQQSELRGSKSLISLAMARNLSFVSVEAVEKEMCISRVHEIARRSNIPKARKARRGYYHARTSDHG